MASVTPPPSLPQTVESYSNLLMRDWDGKSAIDFITQVANRALTFEESRALKMDGPKKGKFMAEWEVNLAVDCFYSVFRQRLHQLNIDLDNVEQFHLASLALKRMLGGLLDPKLAEAARCADVALANRLKRKLKTTFSRLEERELQDISHKYNLQPLENITIESYLQIIAVLQRCFPNKPAPDLEMAFRQEVCSRREEEFRVLFGEVMTRGTRRYIAFKETLMERFEKQRVLIQRTIDEFKRASAERFKSLDKRAEAKEAYLKKRRELGLATPGPLTEEACLALDDGDNQALQAEKIHLRSQIEASHCTQTVFREALAKLRAIKLLPKVLEERDIHKIAHHLASFYIELGMKVAEENKTQRFNALHTTELAYKSLIKSFNLC